MSAALSNPGAAFDLPAPSPRLGRAIVVYRAADDAITEYNHVLMRNGATRRELTDEETQHALGLQNQANAARHEVHRLVDLEYLIARPEQRALRVAD